MTKPYVYGQNRYSFWQFFEGHNTCYMNYNVYAINMNLHGGSLCCIPWRELFFIRPEFIITYTLFEKAE